MGGGTERTNRPVGGESIRFTSQRPRPDLRAQRMQWRTDQGKLLLLIMCTVVIPGLVMGKWSGLGRARLKNSTGREGRCGER